MQEHPRQTVTSPLTPTAVARVPSNIALLKYWGKQCTTNQWPANGSISMTLDHAFTLTKARLNLAPIGEERGSDEIFHSPIPSDHPFKAQSHPDSSASISPSSAPSFGKAKTHLERLRQLTGFSQPLVVETHNTFPAECGIASSASGLGALTLAALAAWTGARSLGELEAQGYDRGRLASLARLGSGSACRSFWGGFVAWEPGATADSQRVYPLAVDPSFKLADLIVILSQSRKDVSSSDGHRLAWSSPFFAPRLAQHGERMAQMLNALGRGDIEQVGSIMELEAMEMHAVMMTAQPPARYWVPETSQLIAWIRSERLKGKMPAWFTIDAGPNVHLLCAASDAPAVRSHLATFQPHSPSQSHTSLAILPDFTGSGPLLTVE